MTAPIKHCPQPDPPELVMRADGYHYRTENEMKDTQRELFEDWVKSAHPGSPLDQEHGKYTGVFAAWAWGAWKAAIALNAADRDVMRKAPATVLPDGSAFFTGSLPLPKDHWLYAPRCAEWDDARGTTADTPHPILTHEIRDRVVDAVRYAVRGATMCGAEKDFDPDAIVQNAVYALCGPYGDCTSAASPTPPAEQPGDDTLSPVYKTADELIAALDAEQVEQEPIIYKRSEFTKNWTTFNVRRECADAAEARLKSPSLATLRAKVEALPKGYRRGGDDLIFRSDVLAEIDKLGGGA